MADQNQNQPNQQVAVPLQNDFVRTARILAQRTRRNNVTRRRAVTKDEREALAEIRRKKRRVLTGVRPRFPTKAADTQSHAFTFPTSTDDPTREMFLPDNNARNSMNAIASNVNGLIETTDGHQACIYALGILCCLNPNFENSLPPGVSRIGFNINTIRLPSQAEGNLIDLDAIPKLDNASYLTIFGQTILFIFKTATSQNFNYYNTVRLNGLKAAAGVDASTTVTNPYNLSKAQCVRSVLGSSLFVKKKLINMIVSMQNGEEKINAVCRYVATILEYNEMSAIMVTYETLVRTKSVVLTDPRLLPEMMNLCEALELICQSDMPQYFKYMAPPEQAAKLERNRFPTLAATGELLKRDFNKHASFKNFVGERKFSKLAEELAQLHRRSVARNTPATLDVLTKQPCHPVGPTIIGDDEDWDDVC